MSPCHGNLCSYGYQTVTNPEGGALSGAYRSFLEVTSFVVFLSGVTMNSAILIILFTAYRTLDILDGFLINLIFGELVASFGLAFLMFYQFASTLVPIGDGGCSFITWLDVTSVSITVTSIIAITFTLYNKLFYGESYRLHRWKFIGCICLTWVVAGLPGLPYLATAEMGQDNYCTISNWSHGAEIIFICGMIVFQIILPLSLLVFLFVRIFLALKVSPSEDGDTVLNEECTPGTEANFQRVIIKQQVVFVVLIIIIFYIFLIISSFIALAIELNINDVKADWKKYARIRELVSVFEYLKCIVIPIIYIVYYDKLKNQSRKICCHRNQEMYKNLRYSVYQQTVHETTNEPSVINDHSSREMIVNDEIFETDRDDVAILHVH